MRAHSDAESVPAGVYCEKSDHCAHMSLVCDLLYVRSPVSGSSLRTILERGDIDLAGRYPLGRAVRIGNLTSNLGFFSLIRLVFSPEGRTFALELFRQIFPATCTLLRS